MTSKKSRYALLLRGYAHDPIRDIRLVDCVFDGVESPDVVENVAGVTLTNVRVNGHLRNETITRGPAGRAAASGVAWGLGSGSRAAGVLPRRKAG